MKHQHQHCHQTEDKTEQSGGPGPHRRHEKSPQQNSSMNNNSDSPVMRKLRAQQQKSSNSRTAQQPKVQRAEETDEVIENKHSDIDDGNRLSRSVGTKVNLNGHSKKVAADDHKLGSDHLEGNQFSDAKKSSDINTSDAKKDNHNLNSNSQTLSHEHSKPLYSKKTSSKTETQALKRTPNPTSTQQLSKPQLEVVSAATGDTLEPIRNSAQKAQEKSKPKFKENVEPEEVFVELHPLPRDKSCEQIAQTENVISRNSTIHNRDRKLH
ncbi:uncharacterized protein LOC142344911 [Convolutriloba macropyga]|uniref:uncharacterized protein LOC142344911 n=1 Tax=Convolutriloba macropyga TaxID=536237 RepID=UPI003F52069A